MTDAAPRMVKLTELWERTSARGTRYFSGFLGDSQLLLFDGGEKPHPTRPGETVHVWRLMVQERDPARRPAPRPRPAERAAVARQHQRLNADADRAAARDDDGFDWVRGDSVPELVG